MQADVNALSCKVKKSIPNFKDLCTIYGHVREAKGSSC